MLGSVRAVTNQNGEIVSRRDFLPFGKELPDSSTPGHSNSLRTSAAGYGTDNIRQKFTGYQKDEETGLDFAEARMYENRHGRFTAVDPLLASGKSANPQTFNRFTYVLGSPLVLVDRNGQWPTKTHDDLIKEAFNGLTARQINLIQKGSFSVDVGFEKRLGGAPFPRTMLPANAFMHAMRSSGMTQETAMKKASEYLNKKLEEVQQLQKSFEEQGGKGLAETALIALGTATHVYEDMTSPAHGFDKEFDIPKTHGHSDSFAKAKIGEMADEMEAVDLRQLYKETKEHSEAESRPPNEEERAQSTLYSRAFFLLAFGKEKFKTLEMSEEEKKRAVDLAKRYNPDIKFD
ncbi:MAG: RHS repeat-associated core domain-containing protein [Pyrinomonadaceae bacterium]